MNERDASLLINGLYDSPYSYLVNYAVHVETVRNLLKMSRRRHF
jgi:hypothetical protein